MTKKLLVFSVVAFLAFAADAQAQRGSRGSRPVELGIDGGVIFGLDDPNFTLVSLPLQDFRLGFFYNDNLEIEPRFNLTSGHGGGVTATDYTLELGALFLPSGDRVGKGLYFRPFLGVTGSKLSGGGADASDNNGYAGVGFGVKIPFTDRRLATRLEANYTHGFGDASTNALGLLLGLSFYTR